MSTNGQFPDFNQNKNAQSHRTLLEKMDTAFGEYYQQAEKLSILLGAPRDALSWTSYHNLLKQRTAETVAFEKYRAIRDELFGFIQHPNVEKPR